MKIFHRVILLATAFLFAASAYAQEAEPYEYTRKWDIEAGFGPSVIFNKCGYYKKNNPGISAYAELRHNPSTHPVKLGGQLSITGNWRKTGGTDWKGAEEKQPFSSWNALALAELPFFISNRAEMFVSAGAGIGGYMEGNRSGSDFSLCFMPRIGMDFNHRFRLGVYYMAEKKEFSHLGFSIGFIIGGGLYARPDRPDRSTFIGAGAGISF
ncbi:MAG: hypothetical protein J6X91_05285 [Bacteroidales bacterium]|nr:hypothetical protein [Bacteroidales bacterium]MBP5518052.1 hypothetical protein [Bacteroidales bacterium]